MKTLKKLFNQWSTVRGIVGLVAVGAGQDPAKAIALADQLPQVTLGLMAMYELLRDGSKEKVIAD